MQNFTIAVPIVFTLAAAITSAGAQEAASTKPSLHQSGCIDFSAEYEGCLSFGPRPEGERSVVRHDSNRLHILVSIDPNTWSRKPHLAIPAADNFDVP
jgi:hypothetical protein